MEEQKQKENNDNVPIMRGDTVVINDPYHQESTETILGCTEFVVAHITAVTRFGATLHIATLVAPGDFSATLKQGDHSQKVKRTRIPLERLVRISPPKGQS